MGCVRQKCAAESGIHSIQCIMDKFERHCSAKKNVTIERHAFFSPNQEGERFNSFLTDLKLKAKTCEFGDLKDSLIKDEIVSGMRNDQVRCRLLRESNLSLQKLKIYVE